MTLFKQPAATQPFSSDMFMRFFPFQPFRTIADVNYVQSVGLSVLYCLKNESLQNKKIHSIGTTIYFSLEFSKVVEISSPRLDLHKKILVKCGMSFGCVTQCSLIFYVPGDL